MQLVFTKHRIHNVNQLNFNISWNEETRYYLQKTDLSIIGSTEYIRSIVSSDEIIVFYLKN